MNALSCILASVVIIAELLAIWVVRLIREAKENESNVKRIEVALLEIRQNYEGQLGHANRVIQKLLSQRPPNFDFPVNVPDISRDERIAVAAFFATPVGKLLLLRLRASCVNMAITAGMNKQFVAARASEAHGYSECLTQLQSLSVVPTASDDPAPSQEDEAGEMLKKVSP